MHLWSITFLLLLFFQRNDIVRMTMFQIKKENHKWRILKANITRKVKYTHNQVEWFVGCLSGYVRIIFLPPFSGKFMQTNHY